MELFGWGRKNTVDVNEKGQMKVYAEHFATDYEAAHEGEAFTMDIDAVSVNGAEHLAVIKNGHSTKELVITDVSLWCAEYKSTTFLEASLGEAFSYLAEGTAVVPANMRSDKLGGAQGSFYVIAVAGTDMTTFVTTNAVIAGRHIWGTAFAKWQKESGWHVAPGGVFSLFNNGNDNKYSGYISFYYKEA